MENKNYPSVYSMINTLYNNLHTKHVSRLDAPCPQRLVMTNASILITIHNYLHRIWRVQSGD